MPEQSEAQHVAILSAWPYANGPRHIGHGASLLPADVLARYHRAIGNDVIMVSGTDEYGTPNTIAADAAGQDVSDYVNDVNETIRDDFEALDMSFDWFTRTTTEQHKETSQNLFSKLAENGYLEKRNMLGSFDSLTGQALPDRYVEGTCPNCQEHSRGDQCESCDTLLDPTDLLEPHSRITSNPVRFQETEHWFLKLDELAPKIKDWITNNQRLRPNAKTFSLNQLDDLRPRAITRDMDWGVPLPRGYDDLAGSDHKVLYVWFEAVTGYLSASVEWAINQGDPDKWKDWWLNPEANHVYAMGKDNVPFHTIIWPSMLIGASEKDHIPLHLPDQIASTEYLTLGSKKFSSSRNNVIYIRDLIDLVGVDPTRFYLLSSGVETHDKVFKPSDLVTANNDELLAKWGNLVNRTLTLTTRKVGNTVPEEVEVDHLSPSSRRIIEDIHETYDRVGKLLNDARFAAAIRRLLQLCVHTNKYFNDEAPWREAPEGHKLTAEALYIAIVAIDNLSRMFTPIIPKSSQRVQEMLGYDHNIIGTIQHKTALDGTKVLTGNYETTKGIWKYQETKQGQRLRPGGLLFRRFDIEFIEHGLAEATRQRQTK